MLYLDVPMVFSRPEPSYIITVIHSINMTVPSDVPESLEYHFDAKTVLLFFLFQTPTSQEPPNGFQ